MVDKKRFALVLHSHIPHVMNHGRWPHGSDWLSEVACETYMPFISAIEQLLSEGIRPCITIGLTPILCEQLASGIFKEEFPLFLKTRRDNALKDRDELAASATEKHLAPIAEMWAGYYQDAIDMFDRLGRDIVGAFRQLEDAGAIEIISCAATHGFLPLLYDDTRVREQVHIGIETHKKHFGRPPKGFWLPECAYRPAGEWQRPVDGTGSVTRAGIEEILADEGIKYFIVDSHLVTSGTPLGTYRHLFEAEETPLMPVETTSGAPTHRGYRVGRSQVACYVRDAACGLQVWSGEHGYPGDPAYLEFHKRRWPGGMRYWRVTGPDKDLGSKLPYDHNAVNERASKQAWHFVGLVRWAVREGGIICAPYDAELFGHWWHEGMEWIKEVFRLIHADDELSSVTLSDDLDSNPPQDHIALPAGSWGDGGGYNVWLNEDTKWMWKELYPLSERLDRLAGDNRNTTGNDTHHFLGLAKRQMLLAEASDWPFLITTGSVKDYARERFSGHIEAATKMLDLVERIYSGAEITPEDRAFAEKTDALDFPFAGLL